MEGNIQRLWKEWKTVNTFYFDQTTDANICSAWLLFSSFHSSWKAVTTLLQSEYRDQMEP